MNDSSFETIPTPVTKIVNPSFEELNEMIAKMPNAKKTEFGNFNIFTKVHSRSAPNTFVVSGDPESVGKPAISKVDADRFAQMQNDYISKNKMIIIEGYIGNDPEARIKAKLMIEPVASNIAAMQKTLYYPLEEGDDSEPKINVIYTPGLKAKGFSDDRLIAVDLDHNVTRIFNSDYFGESKKAGLRMWNKIVYDRGGIPLHAGAKIIPTDKGEKTILIIGLSGTGKTTTTFTVQNNSRPVQDDFLALMSDGKVFATEAGCFAKTFGLNPDTEKAIYDATVNPNSYLENVSQDENGKVDFFDTSFTKNGRSVFSLDLIENAGKTSDIKKADALIILNRNENIIPAVCKLSKIQAAAYFMLGETTGTSAGGKSEEGKALRIPGTNPFFPMPDDFQGNRLQEILDQIDLDVYIMNTGRVGGPTDIESSKKIKIPHSSAIVEGIAFDSIKWEEDSDFGYLRASDVPGISEEDNDLLNPKQLYETSGRLNEYVAIMESLKKERKEFLAKFSKLNKEILESIE
ncbi:phosphoenolpyruvate carboxykinase [Candidatus Peregrinibacteria bacterium]|nr:phosphoenolpyruvate carboxykinase [Candidatus Peregrinibacteria bacterium]